MDSTARSIASAAESTMKPSSARGLPQVASRPLDFVRPLTAGISTDAGPKPTSPARRAFSRLQKKSAKQAFQLKQERYERLNQRLQATDDGRALRVASDAEVEAVALMLKRRMDEIIPDPKARGWYKMFIHLDDDCSGKITYWELEDMVRNELQLSTRQFPEERLQAIWRALDEDKSGLISCGEFGHFMRKGLAAQRSKSPGWKAKQQNVASARAKALREQKERRLQERNALMDAELERRRELASTSHDSCWGFASTSQPVQWRSPRAFML